MPKHSQQQKPQQQSLREVFADPVMRYGAIITTLLLLLLYGFIGYRFFYPPSTYESWVVNRVQSIEDKGSHILVHYDRGRNAALLPNDGYEYKIGGTYWITVKMRRGAVQEILSREEK